MKAVIFCVETNKHANTDWIYIKETLRRFYKTDNVKIDRIYMGTKNKYKSRSVIDEINSWKKVYKDDLVVIYCIDTDRYESNATQNKELEEVSRYCNSKGYEFVWFCHDVEEVYWGNSVNNTDKRNESIRFYKSKHIEIIDSDKLRKGIMKSGYSNILIVLDEYLDR